MTALCRKDGHEMRNKPIKTKGKTSANVNVKFLLIKYTISSVEWGGNSDTKCPDADAMLPNTSSAAEHPGALTLSVEAKTVIRSGFIWLHSAMCLELDQGWWDCSVNSDQRRTLNSPEDH